MLHVSVSNACNKELQYLLAGFDVGGLIGVATQVISMPRVRPEGPTPWLWRPTLSITGVPLNVPIMPSIATILAFVSGRAELHWMSNLGSVPGWGYTTLRNHSGIRKSSRG